MDSFLKAALEVLTHPAVTPLLVILGWIVAGLYAKRNIHIAHEKTRTLQDELSNRSIRTKLHDDLIEASREVIASIENFKAAVINTDSNLKVAVAFAKKTELGMVPDWKTRITQIYNAHPKLDEAFVLLEIWLHTSYGQITNPALLEKIIDDYKIAFYGSSNLQADDDLWGPLQIELLKTQKLGPTKETSESFSKCRTSVIDGLDYFKQRILEFARVSLHNLLAYSTDD